MRKLRRNPFLEIFLIGALLGAAFFLIIYGFDILDVTNDSWLLTGRDLQQHYIGWKFFRNADWTFPIGLHDGLTYPHNISVLYTDSIPLFAIFFKLLSPILPDTFQYFGLFGLMCFVLNGGIGALLVAKINRSKIFCLFGSIFFILSTPVLQRLFGLLDEDSRHTSLAAHFLILASIGIWMYREKFAKYWKAALMYSLIGVLCVLIQMYMIFIVGGIMCGYLLHCLLKYRDWKRGVIVFASFMLSSLAAFFIVGGFTDILKPTANGFGIYSANINALLNPFNYSTFFHKRPWHAGQYEGFSYLGLGMIVLYAACMALLVIAIVKAGGIRQAWLRLKDKYRRHREGTIAITIVVLVFWILALTHTIYLGSRMVVWFYIPDKILELLAVIRSSGRFMWVILYLIMLLGMYVITRFIPNKKIQKIVIIICVCLQIADLVKPMNNIHEQYTGIPEEEDIYVKDSFWKEQFGSYKRLVYFPLDSCGFYHMLQVGTKASYFDMKMNYFYTSRFYKDRIEKEENRNNKKVFEENRLEEDTVYVLDYINAHKYKDRCYLYQVDNLIVAVKNPIPGLERYNDVYVSEEDPVLELGLGYTERGISMAHNGWNFPDYGEKGMWTTKQSVLKIYSGGAKRVRISIEYESGRKKGKTKVRFNGRKKCDIDNKSSGVVEFETDVKETVDAKKKKGVNWLFFNTDDTFTVKENGAEEIRGIFVRKVTVTYLK